MGGPNKSQGQAQKKTEVKSLGASEGDKLLEAFTKLETRLTNGFDDLKTKVTNYTESVSKFDDRISKLENKIDQITNGNTVSCKCRAEDSLPPLNCIDKCIVISGLPFDHGEDLNYKIETLFDLFVPEIQKDQIKILDCKRMGKAPTPLVKVAMSPTSRAIILDNKFGLKNTRMYRVHIRPSMTSEQRNWNNNMRVLAN